MSQAPPPAPIIFTFQDSITPMARGSSGSRASGPKFSRVGPGCPRNGSNSPKGGPSRKATGTGLSRIEAPCSLRPRWTHRLGRMVPSINPIRRSRRRTTDSFMAHWAGQIRITTATRGATTTIAANTTAMRVTGRCRLTTDILTIRFTARSAIPTTRATHPSPIRSMGTVVSEGTDTDTQVMAWALLAIPWAACSGSAIPSMG